jgi:outer membrane protein TolC
MKRLSFFLAAFVALAASERWRAAEVSVPSELTLSQCLNLALQHNPALRTASEGFLTAQGQAITLHAILYPTANVQALTTPVTFYIQIQETLLSHATLPSLRLSRLDREEAFLNYRQTAIDVVYQVRQAFTAALGAGRLADLNRQTIQERDDAVKTARQLFDAGKAQRSDVAQLQVLALLAHQGNALNGLNQQQSILALAQAIGVDLPASVKLRGDLRPDPGTDFDVAKLSNEALRDREDLKLLENLRLGAAEQVEIDQKNAWPIVGFESNSAIEPPTFLPGSASYDLNRNFDQPQTQRQPGNTQLPLSLYATWTIFDGGNLAGLRTTEQAKIDSQQVAIEALKRSIPGEVASAVASIASARATLSLLDAQMPAADLRHDAETEYQAGRARLLDKINLDTDIVGQQQLRLESQIRLDLALTALDHALGRGLQAPATALSLSSP